MIFQKFSSFLFVGFIVSNLFSSCRFSNTSDQSNYLLRQTYDTLVMKSECMLTIDPDSAVILADSALQLSIRLSEDVHQSALLFSPYSILTEAHWLTGKADSSFAIMERAIRHFTLLGDTLQRAKSELYLGRLRLNSGQLVMAERHLTQAIHLFRETGQEFRLANALMSYGQLLTERGEYTRSQENLMKAYRIFQRLDSLQQCNTVCLDIGNNHADMNRFRDALFYYRIAEKGPYNTEYHPTRISALINIGILYRTIDPDSALWYYNKALASGEDNIDMMDLIRLKLNKANVYAGIGSSEQAMTLYWDVLNKCHQQSLFPGIIRAYNGISVLYENQGDITRAISYAQSALKLADSIGDFKMSIMLEDGLAVLYAKNHEHEKSAELYRKSKLLADSIHQADKISATKEMEKLNEEYGKELEFNTVSNDLQKEKFIRRFQMILMIILALGATVLALFLRKIHLLYRERQNAYQVLMENYLQERSSSGYSESVTKVSTPAETNDTGEVDTKFLLKELIQYYKQEKPYLDPKLRLETVTEKLNCSHRHLISALKGFRYPNFTGFTNYFRVEEAIRIMEDPKYKNYKVEAIATMAGFGNKVTFYSAFEKQVGVKPSWFRSSMLEKMKHTDSGINASPTAA
jgi:tetratricopeptide (TPR) repeat protein